MEGLESKKTVVFVTGPSGAGRTTALHAFEDLGFEVIDNLPLELLPDLMKSSALDLPLALGIDVRNRNFSVAATLDAVDYVNLIENYESSLLFLDATRDVLLRRFSETRRRHPLHVSKSLNETIIEETELLERLRTRSDIFIDTSDLSPHELKSQITKWFGADGSGRLSISLLSFSYKRGLPKGVDMVIDCRFLKNPHWDENLRAKTGLEHDVASYIKTDPKFETFYDKVKSLVFFTLPAYLQEGKAHFGLAFGCTGGRHRSVFLTDMLSEDLKSAGWLVKTSHREIKETT